MRASGEIFVRNGVALGGYDVVRIYDHGQIERGHSAYQCTFRGAVWYFTNSQNLTFFRKNPSKYLPAYGGYCAYGISQGYKAPTLIHLFAVVDGVLYFNFSPYIKRYWVRHQYALIHGANEQWPHIQKDEMIRVNYYWIYLKYLIYKVLGIPFFGSLDTSQATV